MNFGPSKFTSPVYEPSPAEIDKALKYAITLMVSHDGVYIQACHELKFKEDAIYERGEGLLPAALRSEFMNKLPAWCESASRPPEFLDEVRWPRKEGVDLARRVSAPFAVKSYKRLR